MLAINRSKKYAVAALRLTLALIFVSASIQGQTTERLAKQKFILDRQVETAFQWRQSPRWEAGMLVGYDNNRSRAPILYTIDRDGRRDETLFSFPDAAWVSINDISASADGELAIVGSAIAGDTRGTGYIARITKDRQHQTVTRTWPYGPCVVTFAPDGTLWTIGNLLSEDGTRDVAYNVLKRYDRFGKEITSRVLRLNGPNRAKTPETTYLRANKDHVGWFGRSGEYIEFSFDGSEIVRYATPPIDIGLEISGFVLTDAGDALVGYSPKGQTEFLVLNRNTSVWDPMVLAREQIPGWVFVLGFDGPTLVTYSRAGTLRLYKAQ